ncbi:hypothetical protein SNEBB_007923 [Seison nebaliae]|nr:hypothetical protein SNEBB_007923 [Seison nebaliae]
MSDILSIIRHMLETDCQELTNILTHLEVIGFLCYIQINKTLKLIYEYLTNLLNNPQMQLAFEDNVHSFIDDLAKRSKFVHINEIEKEETEEESDNHSENVYEAMKDKTINSLKQFGNTLSHSNWVDKFISELGLNCEKDSLTIDKNKLTDFIEDCSIGYYRQIFVGNTLQPILNNIVFEKTKEKEKIIDYYKELKLDYEIRNEININMEYNLQLLEGRLADVNLEIINIVNLMKVVNLDDQNRNNKSNVVVLEHIFQMILLYLMLEPKNYFTLTEYIGRLLLHQ